MTSQAVADWAKVWPAPAKLNLCLHVTGQREDGYHELETIFQLINLCDYIQLTPREDTQIIRSRGLSSIPSEQDLVIKAAQLLRNAFAERSQRQLCGISIACKKNIPVQAGLGGGSSDAATVLIALNYLWQCQFSISDLAKMGANLGADVPVFVHGFSAYARGVGEALTPINLPNRQYLIVKPQINISTAQVFHNKRLTRDTKVVTIRALLEPMQANSQVLTGHNDCEAVVCEVYPEIKQLIDFLKQFGEARLTGTGSSVFLVCDSSMDIERIQKQLSEKSFALNSQTYIVNGLNKSPLHAVLV